MMDCATRRWMMKRCDGLCHTALVIQRYVSTDTVKQEWDSTQFLLINNPWIKLSTVSASRVEGAIGENKEWSPVEMETSEEFMDLLTEVAVFYGITDIRYHKERQMTTQEGWILSRKKREARRVFYGLC
jgi:hypothetical protein